MKKTINALSLFANVGIAETYLSSIGINVVLANEINKKRVEFYKHLYPKTKVICGDITNECVRDEIIEDCKKMKIDLIMATPPCQGMSTIGKRDKLDVRNCLILYAIDIVQKLKPRFVFFENIPKELETTIQYKGFETLIPDVLKKELGTDYFFNQKFIVNAKDYSVRQDRRRCIFLLTRKDEQFIWDLPPKDKNVINLKQANGNLPSIDPFLYDVDQKTRDSVFPDYLKKRDKALSISKWNYPPKHIYRQVISLMHTPTGETAFDNIDEFKPKKKDGSFVKGFKNTYKRQSWDKPGTTVTMFNRTIGSQNNVHPGRLMGKDSNGYDIYSDARVLTIYELLIVSSLPTDWDIPEWASDHFVRQVIGEEIPPLLVKKIMGELLKL